MLVKSPLAPHCPPGQRPYGPAAKEGYKGTLVLLEPIIEGLGVYYGQEYYISYFTLGIRIFSNGGAPSSKALTVRFPHVPSYQKTYHRVSY